MEKHDQISGPRPRHFIVRPGPNPATSSTSTSAPAMPGILVPLVAVDELPPWLEIGGAPRSLAIEEAKRMTNLGNYPRKNSDAGDGSTSAYFDVFLDEDIIVRMMKDHTEASAQPDTAPEEEASSTAISETEKDEQAAQAAQASRKSSREGGLANSVHAGQEEHPHKHQPEQHEQHHSSQQRQHQHGHPQHHQDSTQHTHQPPYQPPVEISPYTPNSYRPSKTAYQPNAHFPYPQGPNENTTPYPNHRGPYAQAHNHLPGPNSTRPRTAFSPSPYPRPNPASHSNGSGTTSYCRHWCHHGTCKWGFNCRYHHAMPTTLAGLTEVGLAEFPAWWVAVMEMMRGVSMTTAASAGGMSGFGGAGGGAAQGGGGVGGGDAVGAGPMGGAGGLGFPMMNPAAAAAATRMMMGAGGGGGSANAVGKRAGGKHKIPKGAGGAGRHGPGGYGKDGEDSAERDRDGDYQDEAQLRRPGHGKRKGAAQQVGVAQAGANHREDPASVPQAEERLIDI